MLVCSVTTSMISTGIGTKVENKNVCGLDFFLLFIIWNQTITRVDKKCIPECIFVVPRFRNI